MTFLYICSDIPNGYVVKYDIEYAYKNTLPLWAFGLTINNFTI